MSSHLVFWSKTLTSFLFILFPPSFLFFYNGEGALRGQRHITSKHLPKYPPRDFVSVQTIDRT